MKTTRRKPRGNRHAVKKWKKADNCWRWPADNIVTNRESFIKRLRYWRELKKETISAHAGVKTSLFSNLRE